MGSGVIDLHSHILPGVDDGVRTLNEACDSRLVAAADGVTAIAATPHVRADYPTTAEVMEAGVAESARGLSRRRHRRPGRPRGRGRPRPALGRAPAGAPPLHDSRRRGATSCSSFPTAAGRSRSTPPSPRLVQRGITPLLAHPERNPEVQDRPDRVAALVEAGALVQVTAASLDGGSTGRPSRRPSGCSSSASSTCSRATRMVHTSSAKAWPPRRNGRRRRTRRAT